jgi:hypothetical protein
VFLCFRCKGKSLVDTFSFVCGRDLGGFVFIGVIVVWCPKYLRTFIFPPKDGVPRAKRKHMPKRFYSVEHPLSSTGYVFVVSTKAIVALLSCHSGYLDHRRIIY